MFCTRAVVRAFRTFAVAALLLAPSAGCGPKPPPATQKTARVPADTDASVDASSDDAALFDGVPVEAPEPDAGAVLVLPPAETPEEVAERWLEALRRASPELLSTWSRYPFFLHDTGAEGTCGHGAAGDAAQLPLLLSCLLRNEPLLLELRSNSEPAARVLKPNDLPAWAKPWRSELPKEATPVLVDIAGRGTSSHFVFVVQDGGVRALWKETVFERR